MTEGYDYIIYSMLMDGQDISNFGMTFDDSTYTLDLTNVGSEWSGGTYTFAMTFSDYLTRSVTAEVSIAINFTTSSDSKVTDTYTDITTETDDKDTSEMTEEELKAEEFAFPDFLVVIKEESTEVEGTFTGKDVEKVMDEKGMLEKDGGIKKKGGGGGEGCHCDESSPKMKGGKKKKAGSKDMFEPGLGKGDDKVSSPSTSSKGESMDTFAPIYGGKRRL